MCKKNYPYQAFYCEENIWQLAKQRNESDGEVWFIINPQNTVATAMQQAAEDQGFVVWDYHVIYYSPSHGIYDLDTLCSFPCLPTHYLQESFANLAPYLEKEYAPYFRVITAVDYLKDFSSDRKHMLDEAGKYHASPPPWSTIGEGNTLSLYYDFNHKQLGEIFSLDEIMERFS